MNRRTRNNRIAQQRAKFNQSQMRVSRAKAAQRSSVVVQAAMFALMGALFGYVMWQLVVYG